MRLKYLWFTFFIFVVAFRVYSQEITIGEDWLEEKFKYEVKELDEFIKRFNFEENILNFNNISEEELILEKKDSNNYIEERAMMLFMLFNLRDSNFTEESTSKFIEYCTSSDNNFQISYYDNDWYAEVICKFIFKEKEVKIPIVLNLQKGINNGIKWVISSVNIKTLNLDINITDSLKFISPMNHELNFMDLYKVFNEHIDNIDQYYSNNHYLNNLNSFTSLLKEGDLKFVEVEDIKYHFMQIPNWIFTVEYFNRMNTNSGWLISSLIEENDIVTKVRYKKNILNILE